MFCHEKKLKAAKTAAGVAIFLAVVIGLHNRKFFSLFRSDKYVIAKAAKFIPFGTTMHLLDVVAAVLARIWRAQGRQRIGGFINLTSYYIVGVPMGLFSVPGPRNLASLAYGWVSSRRWCQHNSNARLRS